MAEKDRAAWAGRERRQSTRVEARVALQLSEAGESQPAGTMTTESINVGAEGVYCFVPQFVAPLTKLSVTMELPLKGKRGQVRNEVMKAEGVVVRCQPAGDERGGYRIACFFSEIEPESRAVLEEYLRQRAAGSTR
ncbi:MAG: PilZ domain-containing protein [Candidatus Eisenbacteria bacterium]|nr:PilZ domain-containing protein [Candidatus Eisenbacteria bacterium]